MDDDDCPSTNPEIIAFNKHVSNLQGDNKKYFGIVMTELADAHDIIDKKCQIEREDVDELNALRNALEEEHETFSSLEEDNANLTKERDMFKAKLKLLKKEKTKIGDAHDKLAKDLENLVKDYKALESENPLLINSNEQLQSRLRMFLYL